MTIHEYILPQDSDLTPCPMGCGGFTEDVAGGPCDKCWREVDDEDEANAPWCDDCGQMPDQCYCDPDNP